MAPARSFVATGLSDWNRPAEAEIVVLLTSEVVSNAVVHAGPHGPGAEIEVSVLRTADLVRVEVADGHAGVPIVGGRALDSPGGRGMVLLDTLASRWGVVHNGSGKVVWFEVQA